MDARKKDEVDATLQPMRWLLLVLLILFDPPWAWAGSRFHERNHTGLLALYGFDDGQLSANLHPTSARDYTGMGLLGNLTTSTSAIVWNADRAGFTIPSAQGGFRAISQLSSSAICQKLSDEFSIEIFVVNPPNVRGVDLVIAGFGDWSPYTQFPTCNLYSSIEGGWRLFTSPGNSIAIQAVMALDGEPSCVEIGIGTFPDAVRHATFRAHQGEFSVISHGSTDQTADPGLSFNASFWARQPTHLQLAIPHPTDAWTGTMYMLAIFDRYISNAEAAQNRIYGPPNSLPVATASDAPIATTEDVTTTLYP